MRVIPIVLLSGGVVAASSLAEPQSGPGQVPARGVEVPRVFLDRIEIPPDIVSGVVDLRLAQLRVMHADLDMAGGRTLVESATRELVGRELLCRAAEAKGLAISDGEIDAHLTTKAKAFGGSVAYRRFLEGNGISWETYKRVASRALLASVYIDREIGRGITVPPSELAEYYRDHREEFIVSRAAKTFDYIEIDLTGSDPPSRRKIEDLLDGFAKPAPAVERIERVHAKVREAYSAGATSRIRWEIRCEDREGDPWWPYLSGIAEGQAFFATDRSRDQVYYYFHATKSEPGVATSLAEASDRIEKELRSRKVAAAVAREVERLSAEHPVEVRFGAGPTK